ncbi:MAG: ArsR family transcriptional regulator, partial [Acidobacteria bacterium]|nr:ArsR family transcriptional regulator [Acidobacteriota bacterium]
LADATRCRMLWLLEQQELTVSELCSVLQLPQSTVSRHLKTLADAGWVTSRRDGTSRYYALASGDADEARTQIWALTRAQLVGRAGIEQDGRRLSSVLAGRSRTSQAFFATAAGEWDHLRDDLFGGQLSVQALVSLLPDHWAVGDLGCGTGPLLPLLSSSVRQVIGVDGSDEMLAAARSRTSHLPNVDLRRGSLEALPIDDGTLDAAVMMLVLHHLPSPAAALSEACRVLKPGGRLLIVDMAPHEHEDYRQQMGHVWLGFSDDHLRRLCEQSGLDLRRVAPLVPVTEARGPTLFAATAVKPVATAFRNSMTATTEE